MSGNSSRTELIGSRNICFVCGSLGAEFILHTKVRAKGAYFPFLEHHDPPEGAEKLNSDGTVSSCTVCFSFLQQQWDTFERSKTSHVKRLYWLKRADNGPYTGAELRLQRDSQMMDYQWSAGEDFDDNTSNTIVNSGLTSNSDRDTKDSNGVLDLSMPDKNANTEVCYICGEEYQRDTLVNVYARAIANCPFFPSLLAYPRPSKSKPIDSSGRVLACDVCHRHLLQQWDHYQRRNIPHPERRYQLGRDTVICLTCGSEQRASQTEYIYLRPNNFGEPYFPFLEKLKLPSGTTTTVNHGVSQVCHSCYKALLHQWKTFELANTSDENRVYQLQDNMWPNSPHVVDRKESDNSSESACYLCAKVYMLVVMKPIFVHPPDENLLTMHFPFIANLQRPTNAIPINDNCVHVCPNCFSCLCHQWNVYQNENVPFENRNYSLLTKINNLKQISPTPDTFPISSPDNLSVNSRISSPKFSTGLMVSGSAITVSQQSCGPLQIPIGSVAAKISSIKMHWDSEKVPPCNSHLTKKATILDSLTYTCNYKPLYESALCLICGEYSEIGKTYCLYAYPHESNSPKNMNSRPFFPFLSKIEGIGEKGSILACQFCFHHLMLQWHNYEISSRPDDNAWQRIYDYHNFICFVCGVSTFRKRLCTITVKMFPFLLNHSKPPSSLILDNGESVVVCKMCFDTLSNQWQDFERMKVPLELRKYNWMMAPPPGNELEIKNTVEAVEKDVSVLSSDCETNTQKTLGLTHGSKPPPLTMIPPASHKSGGRTTATVPPLNQASPNNSSATTNSAMNATRTSSFAAALRKLAKQAIDPCDKEQSAESTSSSPSISHCSSSKRPPPLLVNNMQSSSLSSPPVVTIAPTQTQNSLVDGRKSLDRGMTSMMEPLHLKSEKTKGSPLFSDKREELLSANSDSSVQPSPHRPIPHLRPNRLEESSVRGFQPYRPGEELRHPLVSHLTTFDPAAYSYHPAFITHSPFPHPAFRFDDPYLERYGLIRPPFMPLHSSGLFPHPGMHPMLPGGRYPTDVLSQPLSLVSPGNRISEKNVPINLDSQKLEDYRRKEQEHERQEREHEKLREREREKEKERKRDREKVWEREKTVERVRENSLIIRELESNKSSITSINTEDTHVTKYGSITQGTPREAKKDQYNRCLDDTRQIGLEENLRLNENMWPKNPKHLRRHKEDYHRHQDGYRLTLLKRRSSNLNCTDIDSYNKDIPKNYPPPPLVPPRIEIENIGHSPYEQLISNGLENSSHGYLEIEHQMNKYSHRSPIPICLPDKDRTMYSESVVKDHEAHLLENEKIQNYNLSRSHLDNPPTNFEFHLSKHGHYKCDQLSSIPKHSTNSQFSITSKLDLEEKKLSDGHLQILCTDDSDDESLKEARHISKLLTISSGPPLKLDTSPKKMSFMGKLGLTTQESKNDFDFEKRRKRRKFHRESSISPVELRDMSPPVLFCVKYLADEIHLEPDFQDKVVFFSQLGLHVLSDDKKRELELIWEAIEENKLRNFKANVPDSMHEYKLKSPAPSHHSPPIVMKRKHSDIEKLHPEKLCRSLSISTSNHYLSDNRFVALPESHNRRITQDFVQEFHESVLQTTQQQLKMNKSRNRHLEENVHRKKISMTTTIEDEPRTTKDSYQFYWPGISIVMEAYQRYQAEQKLEKEVLIEHCQQLKVNNQHLNSKAEILSLRMAELIRQKEKLQEDRDYQQSAIDNLKRCLKHMR